MYRIMYFEREDGLEVGIGRGAMSGMELVPEDRVWVYRCNGDQIETLGYDWDGGLGVDVAKVIFAKEVKRHIQGLVPS